MAEPFPSHRLAEQTAQLVGVELRRLRRERGWTRSALCVQLAVATGQVISTATIATYELGTRALSLGRLAVLCYTLGVRPAQVWSVVDRQVFEPSDVPQSDAIEVDLRKVAKITRADLAPARAWARTQLSNSPSSTNSTMVLTPPALTSLATVCGLDVADVAAALRATEAEDEEESDRE